MNSELLFQRATTDDAAEIAVMVGDPLAEIMAAIEQRAFNFDQTETTCRLSRFIEKDLCFAFTTRHEHHRSAGFIALTECRSFYAEGEFSVIPELFVHKEYRSSGVDRSLVSRARGFGSSRGWTCLEVTTPPMPQFDRALAFYKREKFFASGGHKLKISL